MSYLKIEEDSFLSKIRNIRRKYAKSDIDNVQKKIDKYLVPIYGDRKLLRCAVQYLMEVIESSSPKSDSVRINISTTSESLIPGTRQIGILLELKDSDPDLKESTAFKTALRKFIHNEIWTLTRALSTSTGIPLREKVESDNGIVLQHSAGYSLLVWWNDITY